MSNDRHVLAAAIASGSNQILTFNLKDFPKSILDVYEIEALHSDDFIMNASELYPFKVETVRYSLRYPLIVLMRYNVGNQFFYLKN